MFERLPTKKVFRDPLYGYINIYHSLIHKLVDSSVFQRLRRISQLSGVKIVFHGAEHSRFNHSLGVYALAIKLIEDNEVIQQTLSDYEKMLLMTSALLHDIGHGPYSHAFERVFMFSHEMMSAKIIRENEELRTLLNNAHPELLEDVCGIIEQNGKHKIIEQLISSQLDIDRLDYLQRDAYYTGANYGRLDLDRIIRMVSIKDGEIVYKEGSLHAIENYLISRYHMYWQVYFHPKARSYEIILEKIYERIFILLKNKTLTDPYANHLERVIENNDDIDSYLELDDYYVNGLIKRFHSCDDEVLSSLCSLFLNRKLFKYISLSEETHDQSNDILNRYKDKPYFIQMDEVSQVTYYLKTFGIDSSEIKIMNKNGDILSLDDASDIVKGLTLTGKKTVRKLYYYEG